MLYAETWCDVMDSFDETSFRACYPVDEMIAAERDKQQDIHQRMVLVQTAAVLQEETFEPDIHRAESPVEERLPVVEVVDTFAAQLDMVLAAQYHHIQAPQNEEDKRQAEEADLLSAMAHLAAAFPLAPFRSAVVRAT